MQLLGIVARSVATGVLLAAGLTTSVYAQSTLADLVRSAKEFDPMYRAAMAAAQASEQELAGAESLIGPRVTLSSSAFKTERTEESTNFLGKTLQTDRQFNSRLTQIQARQPIYRHRDHVSIDQAQARKEAAQQALLAAEQDLHFRLLESWVDVLSSRELVLVYTQAVAAAEEQATEAERRRKAGETGVQDLEQARARLVQAQAMLLESRATLDIANQEFRHIAGPKAHVPEGFTIADLRAFQRTALNEQQLSDAVDAKNPEILSARHQEDAARFERDKAKADYFPTLEAYVSASRGDNDTNSSIKDEQRIGVQFSMPLYTHGAIGAAVAQADANFRRAQAQTHSTTLKIRLEAISSQTLVRVLETRMSAADRSAEATRLSLRAAQMGVKAGVSSRSEVAQALQEFLGAQRQRVTVRKDYFMAWLRLQKALAALEEPAVVQYEQAFRLAATKQ